MPVKNSAFTRISSTTFLRKVVPSSLCVLLGTLISFLQTAGCIKRDKESRWFAGNIDIHHIPRICFLHQQMLTPPPCINIGHCGYSIFISSCGKTHHGLLGPRRSERQQSVRFRELDLRFNFLPFARGNMVVFVSRSKI